MFAQFVDDYGVEEVVRDIDIFFQGHCSSEQIALAVRKYAVDYLDSLHMLSVQVACDKSVRFSPNIRTCQTCAALWMHINASLMWNGRYPTS